MNDISELRSHLFDALRGLKDKESPMDIDRARAVSDVAKTLIESAKVECDYLRITGETQGTGFITIEPDPHKAITTIDRNKNTQTSVQMIDGARVIRHITK